MILTCGICCVLSCGLPLPSPSSPCHYRDTLLTQRNWMQADDSISQAWVLPDQHCPPQSKTRVGQVPFDMMWGEDNRLLLSCLQVKKPRRNINSSREEPAKCEPHRCCPMQGGYHSHPVATPGRSQQSRTVTSTAKLHCTEKTADIPHTKHSPQITPS